MSFTKENNLPDILRHYLSHIVYIDDEFRVTWQISDTEEVRRPARGNRKIKADVDQVDKEVKEVSEDGLENFCIFVQNHYPNILLSPIRYNVATNNENLFSHMKSARLLILDWSLSNKTSAVNLLQQVNFSGQLRFCVIYTSKLSEAKDEFVNEIANVKEQGFEPAQYEGKTYEYVRADANIYMICEKDKFDFNMIIGALTDVFIKEIGFFPMAFIDMISRLEEKVPYYLNKFSQPFDKLMFLQTNSNGLPLDDMYHNINDMVINNIRSDIDLNNKVLESIYDEQVKVLKELIESPGEFAIKIDKSIGTITTCLKCTDREKSVLRGMSKDVYKEAVQKAIAMPRELYKGMEKAGNYFSMKYSEALANKVCETTSDNEIKKELKKMYEKRYKEKIKAILPVCLTILSDPDRSYDINNLIMSLKTISYDINAQHFTDIFEECYNYDNVNDIMYLKNGQDNHPNRNLLQNKLYPGDIVFKGNFISGNMNECYLCIVPSCHLLRPKKVDGNILFVRGEIYNSFPEKQLRDSEHLTMLPSMGEKDPIYVIWKYHDIMSIDLNQMGRDDFELYYRPYRLMYEYIRQIIGEFVAFYSKSGVEELFLKSNNFMNDLLSNTGMKSR